MVKIIKYCEICNSRLPKGKYSKTCKPECTQILKRLTCKAKYGYEYTNQVPKIKKEMQLSKRISMLCKRKI